jgi:K+-sensing histidine kinase KdpD
MKAENQSLRINISHELKAPVSNLSMLLEMLYEYDDLLEIKKKREIIELGIKETRRLKNLITQFLYLREDIGLETFKLKKYVFHDVIKDIDLSTGLLFFYKNLFISRNLYSFFSNHFILINKDLYSNAVFNLVENASKFTYGNGWISTEADILVSLSMNNFTYKKQGRMSITDNGVGIRKKELFFYSNNSNKDEYVSSLRSKGVGLGVVRNILSLHGVSLAVVSYPKRGTKFFFNSHVIEES